MTQYYYGLRDKDHLKQCVNKAVRVFGGGHKATDALLEITAAETHCGTFPDRHDLKLGVGVTQFDEIALEDLQLRSRGKHRKKLSQYYDVDLDLVKLSDLAYNPELAVALARMKYLLRSEPLPQTLEGRASYWKRFYNSKAGDGSVQGYIAKAKQFI